MDTRCPADTSPPFFSVFYFNFAFTAFQSISSRFGSACFSFRHEEKPISIDATPVQHETQKRQKIRRFFRGGFSLFQLCMVRRFIRGRLTLFVSFRFHSCNLTCKYFLIVVFLNVVSLSSHVHFFRLEVLSCIERRNGPDLQGGRGGKGGTKAIDGSWNCIRHPSSDRAGGPGRGTFSGKALFGSVTTFTADTVFISSRYGEREGGFCMVVSGGMSRAMRPSSFGESFAAYTLGDERGRRWLFFPDSVRIQMVHTGGGGDTY